MNILVPTLIKIRLDRAGLRTCHHSYALTRHAFMSMTGRFRTTFAADIDAAGKGKGLIVHIN